MQISFITLEIEGKSLSSTEFASKIREIETEGFYNEEVANWAERNNYHIIDIEIPQGRYNNRREVLITNY